MQLIARVFPVRTMRAHRFDKVGEPRPVVSTILFSLEPVDALARAPFARMRAMRGTHARRTVIGRVRA